MRSSFNTNTNQLISHWRVRQILGILGFLMPFGMILYSTIGEDSPLLFSISHYYYSAMRDIFTLLLFAMSTFLFVYRGFPGSLDNTYTNIAAFGALLVGFFPTSRGSALAYYWRDHLINEKAGNIIHFIGAILFFGASTILVLRYFTKSNKVQLSALKQKRNGIYHICGWTMALCLIIILVISILPNNGKMGIFWPEAFALWAFGIAWLVKGEAIWSDHLPDE